MKRSASRLHTLERSLKTPRKSRSQARALTVMRLEGGASGVPNARPTRLPKDMEDQIAIVRGRAVGKPSRGLLQLEERLLRTPDAAPVAASMQRYYHAAPSAVVRAAPARAMASDAFSGRYNVESFEDASNALPVSVPRTDYNTGTVPVFSPNPQLQAVIAPVLTQTPAPTMSPQPWAAEQSLRAQRKRALSQDQKDVAASFERDIASIVGSTAATAPEDQQWNDTLRTAAQAPISTPVVNAQPTPTAPQRDAHEVFNQMGLAMNYANRFDLGAMDLSARFDHFDNELALAPQSKPSAPIPVQALSLDEFDLVADLAEISGAQSAPSASEVPVMPSDTPTAAPT